MNYNYSRKWLAALTASVMFGLLPARAVDFHVATAQDLQNALTLAAANNAASNNIYLTNGYYTGNFNYNSSNASSLFVSAETNLTSSQVTLDGGGLGRDMSLASTGIGTFTVNGLTFLRNCGNGSIGALRIAAGQNASVVVQNCEFLSPTNSSGEGLEVTSGSNVTVTACVVTGTGAGGTTGINVSGIPNLTVQSCMIVTNGSGVLFQNPSGINLGMIATITRNSFVGNGSGLVLSDNLVPVSEEDTAFINGNVFTANTLGVSLEFPYMSSGTTVLTNNTFSDNIGSGSVGIYCGKGPVILIGNIFRGNSATSYPYGNSGGGAIINLRNGTATLAENTFIGNSATGSGGGACCLGGSGAITFILSSNVFTQNFASTGGAFYVSCPNVSLQDNLIVNNSQTNASSQGGGVWVDATSNLFMVNNTIFGNTAYGSGGGVAFQVTGTAELLNVYNNIIWGNSAGNYGADVWLAGTGQQKIFENNDVNNMYGVWDIALNNTNVDPQFFNAVGGDFHLQSTSPLLNLGTNGAPDLPLTDLDGNLRTNTLGQVDLGCYEFNTTATLPADTNGTFVITPGEYAAFAAAWKAGQAWTNAPASAPNPNPIPADYVTRAGYLMTNGGTYHNDGSARPTNWKPGP